MYPCPLDHCDVPMYDAEWHKDRSCQFWKLDDEERFDYYEHVEDAKSAKYKAKIEFYSKEENQEQTAKSKDELIKHGRFFFYDTIIPLNSNLKIEPDDLKQEDIFDDQEYEQFDEDYIGFNHFEDINVNLSRSQIINHSLKFFAQQSEIHTKTKLHEHFFFDSKDDDENELLVNLFKEIDLKPKQNVCDIQNQFSIINVINTKLNQQSKNDNYNQAVIEMQNRLKYITNSDMYNNYVQDFLRNYPDYIKPKDYFINHKDIEYNNNNYINELFNFHDNYKDLKIPRSKTKFRIVYLTSGGGKTVLSQKHHLYLDIDTFIARHYNKFKLVENFCNKYKDYSLMSLFFKHTFFVDIDFLQGKILLCNHPNQVPNQFRLGYNEMVLIPQQLNWDIRWFNENYFSLIAIQGKIKYFADYDNYNKVIFNHFIKVKNKQNINSNMYEII